MFTAYAGYFDRSESSELTIVGGWLSTTDKWEKFDADWRIALAKAEVPYFHMKEFAPSAGEFASWKGYETKRRNLIQRLVSIIGDYVEVGVCMVVEHVNFEKANSVYELEETMGNPYVICGKLCVERANEWLRVNRGVPFALRYIFEDGDEGKSRLLRALANVPSVSFEPSRDLPGRVGLRPLQAADFVAWEINKAFRTVGEMQPLHKYRRSFLALQRAVPHVWDQMTYQNLINLCNLGKVPRRDRGQARA